MSTYADRRGHDVAWMTAAEREEYGRRQAELDRTVTVTGQLRHQIGQELRVTFEGDPAYGRTLRWAVLRELRGTVAVFDGFHDCNGIVGTYPDHRPDGVEIDVSTILEVHPASYRAGY